MNRNERTWTAEIMRFLERPSHRRLSAIDGVLTGASYDVDGAPYLGCSIWHHIDENRELLALLREKAPEFLSEHPFVEGYFAHRDSWLTDLAQAAGTPNDSLDDGAPECPRPWPGTEWLHQLVNGPNASKDALEA